MIVTEFLRVERPSCAMADATGSDLLQRYDKSISDEEERIAEVEANESPPPAALSRFASA